MNFKLDLNTTTWDWKNALHLLCSLPPLVFSLYYIQTLPCLFTKPTCTPTINGGWGSTKTKLSLCAYFSSAFFLLLLLLLLQCVSNPPSRHACPSVRRFANSALCLWRRSLMKTTCTHSHAHPNKLQLHHGTTSITTTLYCSPLLSVWQVPFLGFACYCW